MDELTEGNMEKQNIEEGLFCTVIQSNIFIFAFSTGVSRNEPILGTIQDTNQQVWVFQGHTLVVVPRKRSVIPGKELR